MPIVRPRAVEAEYEGAYVRGVMHGTGTLSKNAFERCIVRCMSRHRVTWQSAVELVG
jgi:hypothetical protein